MELEKLKNYGIVENHVDGMRISFLAGCIIDDELYFSSWSENGFYKLDLQTGICRILKKFEKEKKECYLFNEAIHFQNSIWLTPAHNSENIVKINLDNLEITYIPLPDNGKSISDKKGNQYFKFKCCYKEGETEFWLAPIGYNMLLKVNMLTNEIKKWEDFGDERQSRYGTINFIDACFCGDEIWLCPYDYRCLVVFHTLESKFELHEWTHRDKEFNLIKSYKDWIILFSRTKGKSILLINSKTYEEKEILLDIKSQKEVPIRYMVADVVGKYFLIAPFMAEEFIAVDLETGSVQVDVSLHKYGLGKGWKAKRYQSSFRHNSTIVYASDMPEIPIMIYELQENVVSYLDIRVDRAHYNKFIKGLYERNKYAILEKMCRNKKVVVEKKLPLSCYIDSLLYDAESHLNNKTEQNVNGRGIFLNIKDI